MRDLVLLPIALVVVVLEDVVWAGLRALLRLVAAFPPLRRLQAWIAGLPGWAALPLFLVPEGVGRLGELWALALLVRGNAAGALWVYIGVRLVSTLMAVFVYHACEATLLRYGWFAWMIGQARLVRDWAAALVAELRGRLAARGERRLRALRWRLGLLRIAAWRRVYAMKIFR